MNASIYGEEVLSFKDLHDSTNRDPNGGNGGSGGQGGCGGSGGCGGGGGCNGGSGGGNSATSED